MESESYSGKAEKIKTVDSIVNSEIKKKRQILLKEFTLNLYIEQGVNNSKDKYPISNVYLQLGKYYKVHLGEYANWFEKRELKDSSYKVPKDIIAYYGGWFAGQGTDLFIMYNGSEIEVATRLIDSQGSEEEDSKLTYKPMYVYCENAKIKIFEDRRREFDKNVCK